MALSILRLSFVASRPCRVVHPDGRRDNRRLCRYRHARADDIALILHTSGTTSRPKIVPLLQRNVAASALHIQQSLALTPDDRCLNMMPLFHIHGLIAAVTASLAAGASRLVRAGV